MRTSINVQSDIAEVERYLDEGMRLIFEAQGRLRQLECDSACEGHRLIVTRILKAMRRLLRMIQEHRELLGREAAILPIALLAEEKRRWWRSWDKRGYQPKIL